MDFETFFKISRAGRSLSSLASIFCFVIRATDYVGSMLGVRSALGLCCIIYRMISHTLDVAVSLPLVYMQACS